MYYKAKATQCHESKIVLLGFVLSSKRLCFFLRFTSIKAEKMQNDILFKKIPTDNYTLGKKIIPS